MAKFLVFLCVWVGLCDGSNMALFQRALLQQTQEFIHVLDSRRRKDCGCRKGYEFDPTWCWCDAYRFEADSVGDVREWWHNYNTQIFEIKKPRMRVFVMWGLAIATGASNGIKTVCFGVLKDLVWHQGSCLQLEDELPYSFVFSSAQVSFKNQRLIFTLRQQDCKAKDMEQGLFPNVTYKRFVFSMQKGRFFLEQYRYDEMYETINSDGISECVDARFLKDMAKIKPVTIREAGSNLYYSRQRDGGAILMKQITPTLLEKFQTRCYKSKRCKPLEVEIYRAFDFSPKQPWWLDGLKRVR